MTEQTISKLQKYFSNLLYKNVEFIIDGTNDDITRYNTKSFTLEELAKATNQQIEKHDFYVRYIDLYCDDENSPVFGEFDLHDQSLEMYPNCISNKYYSITEHPYQPILPQNFGLYLVINNDTFLNHENPEYMKQIKQLYDKYDYCFIFKEDWYIEFINKNEKEGFDIKFSDESKVIYYGDFGIDSFDEFKNTKDRKSATFEQVQSVLQKYLDQGYTVEELPKLELYFTCKISKFILKYINPNIDITYTQTYDDAGRRRFMISIDVSEIYYKLKEFLNKNSIKVYINKQDDESKIEFLIIGKWTDSQLEQYFTSIDKIPDQLFNNNTNLQQREQIVDTLIQ